MDTLRRGSVRHSVDDPSAVCPLSVDDSSMLCCSFPRRSVCEVPVISRSFSWIFACGGRQRGTAAALTSRHPVVALKDLGVHRASLVIYAAGISACEKGWQWQWALSLLSEMWELTLEPDVIYISYNNYNAGSGACERRPEWRQAALAGLQAGRESFQEAPRTQDRPRRPQWPQEGPR